MINYKKKAGLFCTVTMFYSFIHHPYTLYQPKHNFLSGGRHPLASMASTGRPVESQECERRLGDRNDFIFISGYKITTLVRNYNDQVTAHSKCISTCVASHSVHGGISNAASQLSCQQVVIILFINTIAASTSRWLLIPNSLQDCAKAAVGGGGGGVTVASFTFLLTLVICLFVM